MISRQNTFFDMHVAAVREAYPEVSCPIRIARHVLERIGVTEMPPDEFANFTQDLQAYNLPGTEIRVERGVA